MQPGCEVCYMVPPSARKVQLIIGEKELFFCSGCYPAWATQKAGEIISKLRAALQSAGKSVSEFVGNSFSEIKEYAATLLSKIRGKIEKTLNDELQKDLALLKAILDID